MQGGTNAEQRIRTVDFFKGMAIFAIVCIHVMTLHPREEAVSVASNPLLEFFYVGLITFFLVSGYFYRPKGMGEVILRVLKILIAVIVCILALTTILWGILNLVGQSVPADLYFETILKQLSFGIDLFVEPTDWGSVPTSACWVGTGYYFLWSFPIATLVFYAIVKWSLEDNRNMATVIAALVAITVIYFCFINLALPFFLQLVPMETAFMLIGAWMGQRRTIHKMESDWKDRNVLIAVAVSLVCGLILIYFFPTGLKFNGSYFGEYGGLSAIPFFLISLFCSIVIIYLCSLAVRIPYFSDLFVFLGRYTLQILLLSTFFGKSFSALFYTIPSDTHFPTMPTSVCLAIAVVAIACSVLTTYLASYVIGSVRSRMKQTSANV